MCRLILSNGNVNKSSWILMLLMGYLYVWMPLWILTIHLFSLITNWEVVKGITICQISHFYSAPRDTAFAFDDSISASHHEHAVLGKCQLCMFIMNSLAFSIYPNPACTCWLCKISGVFDLCHIWHAGWFMLHGASDSLASSDAQVNKLQHIFLCFWFGSLSISMLFSISLSFLIVFTLKQMLGWHVEIGLLVILSKNKITDDYWTKIL